MPNIFSEFVNRPLPPIESNKTKFLGALFFGTFIFLFLWVFQPFGLGEYEDILFEICFGYGIVTFVIVLINIILLPVVFKSFFNADTWKVKNDLSMSLWNLLTIAFGNYIYDIYFWHELDHSYSFGDYIMITVAVGIFPIAFATYLFERRMKKEHEVLADKTNLIIQNRKEHIQIVKYSFHSDTKNEMLELIADELLGVKAEGNYCEFYYLDSKQISKKLLRISLKKVSEILKDDVNIIQCHRSYIANLKKVVKLDGNARNLSLHFDNMEFTIPVSRSKEEIVTNAIRHI